MQDQKFESSNAGEEWKNLSSLYDQSPRITADYLCSKINPWLIFVTMHLRKITVRNSFPIAILFIISTLYDIKNGYLPIPIASFQACFNPVCECYRCLEAVELDQPSQPTVILVFGNMPLPNSLGCISPSHHFTPRHMPNTDFHRGFFIGCTPVKG